MIEAGTSYDWLNPSGRPHCTAGSWVGLIAQCAADNLPKRDMLSSRIRCGVCCVLSRIHKQSGSLRTGLPVE